VHASPQFGFHLVQLRLQPFANRLPLARIIHEKRSRCNFPDLSAHSEHDVTNGEFGREETLILKHFGNAERDFQEERDTWSAWLTKGISGNDAENLTSVSA